MADQSLGSRSGHGLSKSIGISSLGHTCALYRDALSTARIRILATQIPTKRLDTEEAGVTEADLPRKNTQTTSFHTFL